MPKKSIKLMVLSFAVSAVGFLTFSVDKVRVQSDDIGAEIYPSEGTRDLDLRLRLYRSCSVV